MTDRPLAEIDLLGAGLWGLNAFVSAGGQGIGRATALAFAAQGARVVAVDIDESALEGLHEDDPRIEVCRLDVTDSCAVAALFSRQAFDVLFNCVGHVHHGTLLECDDAAWSMSLDVNVTSAYRVCRAALPAMIERGGGSIINVASVASSVRGVADRCAYSASKAALIGLGKSIAADYVRHGIRCNTICPGTVLSPSLAARVAARGGDSAAVWRSFEERQPIGRLGRPEEIAALAVYLAGPASAFTTGSVHIIDGGWSM